ncbi:MAG: class I SAM-dependent methyltransferase [Spirochaetaceae bacterium]
MSGTCLFVPDTRRAHGTGHIRRALRLCSSLNEAASVCLDFPWHGAVRTADESLALYDGTDELTSIRWSEVGTVPTSCIIVDAQTANVSEIVQMLAVAPVVGIDLGGEGRSYASFLIDTMVNLEAHRPNIYAPDALELPDRVRTEPPGPAPRALVCMGGDDIASLTEPLVATLDRCKAVAAGSVDVVLSEASLREGSPLPGRLAAYGVTDAIFSTNKLSARLGRYDLVYCTFGLTAFEALAAGCTVCTLSPTDYHARLSRKAGLPLIDGTRVREVQDLMKRLDTIWRAQEAIRPVRRRSIAEIVRSFDPEGCVGEPSGGPAKTPVEVRLPERSFRRESRSGLLYLERFHHLTIEYNDEYFDTAYEKQYGRTYLEDFDHIRAMGLRRLRNIRALRGSDGGVLLDIGCAYGPFLSAANAQGYTCVGMDIFEGATSYVRETLGISAFTGRATELSRSSAHELRDGADVITMWYVIEHIDRLDRMFEGVLDLLKQGGVLAFSTPNGHGVSGRRDMRSFLERSPEDHRTIWTPKSARRYLKNLGFTAIQIRVTGHHPERISSTLARFAVGRRCLQLYSRVLGLGDTFEVYARRGRT